MKRRRQTCRILKEIRRQIAEANDIEFVTSECRYQGECRGTCPRCESEVRWLEEQLRHRSAAGKLIRVAGISAGILALSGCSGSKTPPSTQPVPTDPKPEITAQTIAADTVPQPTFPDTTECKKQATRPGILPREILEGELVYSSTSTSSTNLWELTGALENDPQFPGGQEALFQYVSNHLQYPERCLNEGIQGRVVVQFLVLKDGRVDSVKVVRGKDPDLDAEAIRVIRTLPDFSPATMNGEPIEYWYTLPITFKLTEQNETPEASKPTENQIPNDSLRQS